MATMHQQNSIQPVRGVEKLHVRSLAPAELAECSRLLEVGPLATEDQCERRRQLFRDRLLARACCDAQGQPVEPPAPRSFEALAAYLAAREVNQLEAGMDGEMAEFFLANRVQLGWADLAWHFGEPDVDKLKRAHPNALIYWEGWRAAKLLKGEDLAL